LPYWKANFLKLKPKAIKYDEPTSNLGDFGHQVAACTDRDSWVISLILNELPYNLDGFLDFPGWIALELDHRHCFPWVHHPPLFGKNFPSNSRALVGEFWRGAFVGGLL